MASERIPLLDPVLENTPLLPRIREAIEPLLVASTFGMGAEVEDFEHDVGSFLGVAHAIGMACGSDALSAGLMALDIGPGDEVVTSSFSSFASAAAIARLGATPVFVDIDPVSYHLDLVHIPPAVNERTRAILATHLFGQPCEMSVLRELAGAFSIPILEDASDAFGALTPHGRVGTAGAIACFSFAPTSSFGAFGDAGLVTTDDGDLALRVRRMRAEAAGRVAMHATLGGPSGIDALQAAVLSVKLPEVAAWIEARRAHASLYELLFLESGLTPEFVRPPRRVAPGHAYAAYVVRVARRDALAQALREAGIETDPRPALAVHLQPPFAPLGLGPGAFAHSEEASREVLALPMHAGLTDAQIERVVESIARFFGV